MTLLFQRLRLFAVFLALICQNCFWVKALTLSPMQMSLTPSGRSASGVYRVVNDSDSEIAIVVSILKRRVQVDGTEVNEPAEKDFRLFPPQFKLEPRKSQSIRVRYVGESRLKDEGAYRLVAEQLPISFTRDPGTGVDLKMVIRIKASLYVAPKIARSKVLLESIQSSIEPSGERFLKLRFQNQGAKHQILHGLSISLTPKNGSNVYKILPESLPEVAGANLLARSERVFSIPWPLDLKGDGWKWSIDYVR